MSPRMDNEQQWSSVRQLREWFLRDEHWRMPRRVHHLVAYLVLNDTPQSVGWVAPTVPTIRGRASRVNPVTHKTLMIRRNATLYKQRRLQAQSVRMAVSAVVRSVACALRRARRALVQVRTTVPFVLLERTHLMAVASVQTVTAFVMVQME